MPKPLLRLRLSSGFTLLEIMLVILLMGMTAAAVTLTISSSSSKAKLEKSAKQFVASIEMVLDETVLNGFLVGIAIEDTRYQFLVRKEGKWAPLVAERFVAKRDIEEGITLHLTIDGLPLAQEDEIEETFFDEPFEEADVGFEKEEEIPEPQILIFPSGEMTGFELAFVTKNDDEKDVEVKVIGDSLGRLQIEAVNEDASK